MVSTANEILYGGAAGGGKTDWIVVRPLARVHQRGFRGLILRENFTDLGDIIERSHELYPSAGGIYNASKDGRHVWSFPVRGARPSTIEFGYFSKWADRARYRGRAFCDIGWDELGDCPEERRWLFLMSRCRATAPGLTPLLRGTANPGGAGHGWLKRRFITPCGVDGARTVRETVDLTLDGITHHAVLTRQFIPAKLRDNPTLLTNNPTYAAQLAQMPLTLRRQLLDGDWNAGEGLAFEELDEGQHIVPSFVPPNGWPLFGSFDWGYSHPWVFNLWTANEDGRLYVLDTYIGRRQKDTDIIASIKDRLPKWATPDRLTTIYAGHDCWHEIKAREESGPSTQERFTRAGLPLTKANISRSDGFRHLLQLFAWRGKDANGEDGQPDLVFCDTPGNRRAFDTLTAMVVDPDHGADVLKVDADPVTGEGGDDSYDSIRYGAMSRPRPARSTFATERVRAFDPAVLKAEHDRQRRGRPLPARQPTGGKYGRPDPAAEQGF